MPDQLGKRTVGYRVREITFINYSTTTTVPSTTTFKQQQQQQHHKQTIGPAAKSSPQPWATTIA